MYFLSCHNLNLAFEASSNYLCFKVGSLFLEMVTRFETIGLNSWVLFPLSIQFILSCLQTSVKTAKQSPRYEPTEIEQEEALRQIELLKSKPSYSKPAPLSPYMAAIMQASNDFPAAAASAAPSIQNHTSEFQRQIALKQLAELGNVRLQPPSSSSRSARRRKSSPVKEPLPSANDLGTAQQQPVSAQSPAATKRKSSPVKQPSSDAIETARPQPSSTPPSTSAAKRKSSPAKQPLTDDIQEPFPQAEEVSPPKKLKPALTSKPSVAKVKPLLPRATAPARSVAGKRRSLLPVPSATGGTRRITFAARKPRATGHPGGCSSSTLYRPLTKKFGAGCWVASNECC